MNMYLISQDENVYYDTYDSAVVCAPDADTARNMHPNPSCATPCNWASSPEFVKVIYLGVASPELEQSVVCASFNAG